MSVAPWPSPLAVKPEEEIAAQIAKGLAAAHEKGIVPPDLKRDKVFVSRRRGGKSCGGRRPPDSSGVTEIQWIYLTPDGRSYVYTYPRRLSTLSLVEGLRWGLRLRRSRLRWRERFKGAFELVPERVRKVTPLGSGARPGGVS